MKNVSIETTTNKTFVVYADTKRFGKHEIMFESYRREDCVRYIMRMAVSIIKYSKNAKDRDDAYEVLIRFLPVEKKAQIVRACGRNAYFTSAWTLEWTEVEVIDKGIYLTFRGVQTSVGMWISNEGNICRKPNRKSLTRIDRRSFHNWEDTFEFMLSDIKQEA